MPANNPGSVYQRQDGQWVAALQVEGKRKTVYAKTAAAAKKKLADLHRQVATTGGLPDCGKRTVADLLDAWLAAAGPALKPRTVAEYRAVCARHILPALGRLKLGRLTPAHVQKLYADLQARGLKRAPQEAHSALRRALRLAVLWRWLPENPADRVLRPAYKAPRKDVWQQADLRRFLDATEGCWLHPLWTLAACTGCRLSELLALRWADVAGGRLSVNRGLHRIGGRWVECEPKTKAGHRTVALPPEGVAALRRQKVQQAEWRLRAGPGWEGDELVFSSPTGKPLMFSTVERAMRRECDRLGLSRLTPHGLRHLHASLLLDQGLPVTAVAARLGHANPSITLQVYSHALRGQDEQAAQAIGRALAR